MKVEDKIIFKYNGTTLNYRIIQSLDANCYYLFCDGKSNSEIFNLLEIRNRFSFCEKIIGYPIVNKNASFPTVATLKDLEKIVDALYQRIIDISTPKFKEGEIVKILPKDGPNFDYPFGYIPEMEKLTNTTTTVVQVKRITSIGSLKRCMHLEKYEEPFYYLLKGTGFSWASSILESANENETKIVEVIPPKFNIGDKVKVKTLDRDYRYGTFLNPDMLKYCGKEFEIVFRRYKYSIAINEKCDGYAYYLKGIGDWVWSSDMLEKSEGETKNEPDVTIGITSEPCDLSVMQEESVKIYDATKADSILLPPELLKADINTQTINFGNIKTVIDTIPFKEEKDSNVDYKLNFTVNILDFKK